MEPGTRPFLAFTMKALGVARSKAWWANCVPYAAVARHRKRSVPGLKSPSVEVSVESSSMNARGGAVWRVDGLMNSVSAPYAAIAASSVGPSAEASAARLASNDLPAPEPQNATPVTARSER